MSTTSALASVEASRRQYEVITRWLRPLVPLIMAVVVWSAFVTDPGPGATGRHLAVSIALAGFALGGLGALATLHGGGAVHAASIALLLAASAALVWLQPGGAGVAGIFVGLSLLAPLARGQLWVPITIAVLLVLAVGVAAGTGRSVTSALLSAVTVGAFYGMLFLAIRLGEAGRRTGRLVVELERSRAAEARAAALAERQRLAREMHDVLAHSLSGLMLQLEAARMLAAGDPANPLLAEAVNRAHHLAKSGLDEARHAIDMLRDTELPGPEGLATLAERFERDRGVGCRFTLSGTAHPLSSEARLALYRVAQEALTNASKHARPDRVEVCLAYEPAATRLVVEDFRTGPPVTAGPSDGGGYGLTGMRERAELLGGALHAGPTPAGFRVELELPA